MKTSELMAAQGNCSGLPFKLSVLALCCCAFTSTAALADAAANTAAEKSIERIAVTASPIRDSQEESIMLQREATNVVNVIAADDIGRFPDQTAAAALSRLPAVAVQRDQGQERYIQVRGAPARWTAVSFDGVNVLGAEERVFRFDSVPAAVMSAVDVSKTLTPDMPSEALAGRVDIKTYSPLSKPGFHTDLDLGLGQLQLGDGEQHRYSGRLSWSDGVVGVMGALSGFKMEQVTDNNERTYDADGAPEQFDFRSYLLERETNSAIVKFEFAPQPEHKFALTSLYTEFVDLELRNQFQLDLSKGRGTRGEQSGELIGVPVMAMFQDGQYENSTFVNTLSGQHELSDWELAWDLNYTETESLTDLPILRRSQTDPRQFHSLSYDLSNPLIPKVQLYSTIANADGSLSRGEATSVLNQSGFGFDGLINYKGEAETQAFTLKTDAAYNWQSAGADARLQLGAQYDDRKATSPGMNSPFIMLGPLAGAAGIEFTPDAFNTNKPWDSDQNYGFTANYFDNAAARAQIDTAVAALIGAGLIDPSSFSAIENWYEVTEEITSLYAMNTWTWDQHQILLGVRAERVDILSQGYLKQSDGTTPLDVAQSNTDLFPSLHWNVDLTEDLKFRLSGVTGASRPYFSQLRSGASVNDTDNAVSGGNPNLKAETAVGVDSSLEWYFADAALASVNFFQRKVDNVLFDSVTEVGDNRFDTPGFDRSGYDYNTTLNGDNGKLTGLEFSYIQQWDFLPESIRGFGLQFNMAFLDSEFTTPDGRTVALPGTSDRVINSSLFYENHGWSVRLNWQWRDQWLDDISPDSSGDLYWQDSERLDLSLRYQLNDTFSVYADLNNMTDELGVRFQGSENKPVEVEGYGRRFLMGVRANF